MPTSTKWKVYPGPERTSNRSRADWYCLARGVHLSGQGSTMSEHLMYLGTNDGVLAMRRLPGNWEQVSAGLSGHAVWCLAHRPGRPQEIFAGSYGRGLFYSADAGQTWQPRNTGLTFTHVRSILV